MHPMQLEKIGINLYKMNPENARQLIPGVSQKVYADYRGKTFAFQEELLFQEQNYNELLNDLETQQKLNNIYGYVAVSQYRKAVISLVFAFILALISSIMILWAIQPQFYNKSFFLPILLSVGGGLVLTIGTELVLDYMSKALNKRQFTIFILLISLIMFSCALGGAIMFAKARALNWKIQEYSSESVLENPDMDKEEFNIEEAKKKLENLNSRGMIFIFLGLEWISGLLLFLALKSLKQYHSMAYLIKKKNKTALKILKIKKQISHLNNLSQESISNGISTGIGKAEKCGSVPILVTGLLIILGIVIGCFLYSEDVFGESYKIDRKIVIGYDVTGSTEQDRLENQRAVLRIIDSLKAGDAIQIMLITESTFSNPEYMLSTEMPSKAGYFNEEIKRKKIQLIKQFKQKAEQQSNSRPATALIDGIYLFSKICNESNAKQKILIILSDMRQFSCEINMDTISQKGPKIISALKAENLIPDMRGIDIHVMGVSTAGIPLIQWKQLEKFWISFFAESGGNLKSYSISRHGID